MQPFHFGEILLPTNSALIHFKILPLRSHKLISTLQTAFEKWKQSSLIYLLVLSLTLSITFQQWFYTQKRSGVTGNQIWTVEGSGLTNMGVIGCFVKKILHKTWRIYLFSHCYCGYYIIPKLTQRWLTACLFPMREYSYMQK